MADTLLLLGASTTNQNLYYATRFLAGDPILYLESGSTSTLVVPALELGRARKEGKIKDVRSFNELGYVELYRRYGEAHVALAEVAVRLLHAHDAHHVRVEPTLPVRVADTLRAAWLELTVDPDLIVGQRRQKSPEEVAAIEEAQRATEAALERAMALLEASEERAGALHLDGVPLTSERVRFEIEAHLLEHNLVAEVDPTVAGGPTAADPHARGRGPLRWGEPIVLDIFPRSRSSRYFADITRTVVRGTPPPELRRMYEVVLQAQEEALAAIRAGANGADIHRGVLETFRAAGYDGRPDRPSMPHGTGHGLGLELHEAPRIGEADMELMEGDVVTVEPGLYHPSLGGVRIEDAVVVTRDGYRNLTTMSKRFELGG